MRNGMYALRALSCRVASSLLLHAWHGDSCPGADETLLHGDVISAARMDRQEGDRKRAREGEESAAAAAGRRRQQQQADAVASEEMAPAPVAAAEALVPAAGGGEAGAGAGWQRPEGVFDLPWQKCRGGLGVASGGGGWELRDVFFRSLVDGHAAAIGVPGDRLSAPPSKRTLFDDVDAWLASAGDGEVDPLWRSVLEAGPRPAA